MKNETLVEELERIRLEDPEKKLRPKSVVDAARPVGSPLHTQFEWSDDVAAEKYRLQQARQLIRVAVTVLPRTNQKIRAYCSLADERRQPDEGEDPGSANGYRTTMEVMQSEQLRAMLLRDAMRDLRIARLKYQNLEELSHIFEAIEEAEAEHPPEPPKPPRGKKRAKKKAVRRKTAKKKSKKKGRKAS